MYVESRGVDFDLGPFLTQTDENNVKIFASDTNRLDWILDSVCTYRIINNVEYFSKYINLKEPVDIRVGDGRLLKAAKVGTVVTDFIVNRERIKMSIFNVLCVKGMHKNLISYAKVTDNNDKVVRTVRLLRFIMSLMF